MNLSSLSSTELAARLRGPGLRLRMGAFTADIRTRIDSVIEGIGLLYGDFPLAEADGFVDFHVSLAPPAGMRRWFRPQVLFHVDGRTPFKPLPYDQAFPMFEWGMNWCVSSYANSYLIIHAAVVERNGLAAILPAPPGSGKSTLTAALIHHGWRLLSDELALIRVADGRLVSLPRPVSLKNRSIDVIRGYVPGAVFGPVVTDTTKGTVSHLRPPADSVRRAGDTAQPAWIVFPKYEAGSAPVVEPIPRARAFMRVAENAFNYSLLGERGFAALSRTIESTTAFDFRYSRFEDALATFESLLPEAVAA